ncbi:MAG: hypothetical protein IKZ28_06790 [Clostridia bacterium]|nr:hypothetical protein [Clostridia bacterium]
MNYIKKMCILRQVRQGFSGDGKTLSGLIKVEQYGKNLAVEVSVVNFAPLSSGEYYCLLSDGKGKTEMLALRGKSLFNLLSDLDLSEGFCGIICYVKSEVVPIAYGINGNRTYDWKSILNATLPPVFPNASKSRLQSEIAETIHQTVQNPPTVYGLNEKTPPNPPNPPTPNPAEDEPQRLPPSDTPALPREDIPEPSAIPPIQEPTSPSYDDETVATENYYEEKDDERQQFEETVQNARIESANQDQGTETGANPPSNGDASSVRRTFKTDPDGYYLSVKEEIDSLFQTYPRDDTLKGAFSHSEWVRLKGTEENPEYLVGIVKKDGKALYVCYALAAEDRHSPPEEIKKVCSFVPVSPYEQERGFFVIFQSAASGECIRPELV